MLSHSDISWIAGVQRPAVPLWNKCPGIFPNNPPVCLSVCGKALNGRHLSDCLFVSVKATFFTNHCLYQRRWWDGGAVTFNVRRWREMRMNAGVGKGQEEWDPVMTAKVLTLGDIGPTWYYSLTVRWDTHTCTLAQAEEKKGRGKKVSLLACHQNRKLWNRTQSPSEKKKASSQKLQTHLSLPEKRMFWFNVLKPWPTGMLFCIILFKISGTEIGHKYFHIEYQAANKEALLYLFIFLDPPWLFWTFAPSTRGKNYVLAKHTELFTTGV